MKLGSIRKIKALTLAVLIATGLHVHSYSVKAVEYRPLIVADACCRGVATYFDSMPGTSGCQPIRSSTSSSVGMAGAAPLRVT